MANEESSKFSSQNLKVPPLKIVLSSHQQNNSVVNAVADVEGDELKFKSFDSSAPMFASTDDRANIQCNLDKEGGPIVLKFETVTTSPTSGAAADNNSDDSKNQKKSTRSLSERNESESELQSGVNMTSTSFSSASSSSSGSASSNSDRSSTTTPSSESESIASNSTIISDHAQQPPTQTPAKTSNKDDIGNSKQDKNLKSNLKVANLITDKPIVSNNSRKTQDSNAEQSSETNSNNNSKEQQTLNANQRITRSSQRAAQQNKSDNLSDSNVNDEPMVSENQDKIALSAFSNTSTAAPSSAAANTVQESGRKVKRRKGENQDGAGNEPDNVISNDQPIAMAEIYPADYQLPTHNSFELYRDIRKRPYKKLMKLNSIQPRIPHGFKDYLLNSGPYLLEGNKLGVGLYGAKLENLRNDQAKNGLCKFSSSQPSSSIVNRNVPLSKKLITLHQHQQLQQSNQRMHMSQATQHRHNTYVIPKLNEAPPSLQVDSQLHDLFQDQEKARHQMKMQHLKERERSILTAEQEILRVYNNAAFADVRQKYPLSACTYFYYQERYHYLNLDSNSDNLSNKNSTTCNDQNGKTQDKDDNVDNDANKSSAEQNQDDSFLCAEDGSTEDDTSELTITMSKGNDDSKEQSEEKNKDLPKTEDVMDVDQREDQETSDTHIDKKEEENGDSAAVEDEALRKSFLEQLQDIDDKWGKIMKEMFIRHKNEADSLHAVQSLDWEWKAKEIGSCDVRVPLKIEPEFVPRVEIIALDY